jgi:hypothetical protein
MKKPILLILLIMLACYAHAQTIKGYEYWLDESYASRVITPVTPVQIFHLQQDIDLSAAADGLHFLISGSPTPTTNGAAP